MRPFALNLGLLCFALSIGIGGVEMLARLSDPPLDRGKNTTTDPILGWDAVTPPSSPPPHSGTPVYFVGDSFTEGTSWPRQTQEILQQHGISIDVYNLGVSGYGTLQEFLKLQRHFSEHMPKIVILQFFAWNDLRDNIGTPAVFYSPSRMQRPYLVHTSENAWILQKPFFPFLSSLLSHSSLYVHHLLPHLIARNSPQGPAYLSYTEKRAWDPFYRNNVGKHVFVDSAYAATEEILLRMKQYLEEQKSQLVVLGFDAAFTVDKDVLLAHVEDPSFFDVSLPLARMQSMCETLDIPFINALPALQKEAQSIGKKIYNGPEGNLSGHLEPEGNAVLAHLAAEAIRTYLPEP